MNEIKTPAITPVNMGLVESSYTPFMLHSLSPEGLSKLFDGPVPKAGDVVELYCFKATDTEVHMRFRVAKKA